MAKVIIFLLAFMVTGCTSLQGAFDRVDEVKSTAWDINVKLNCDKVDVETILLKMDTKEKFDAWVEYCTKLSWKNGGFNL